MTTFREISMTCAVCGHTFESTVLRSTNTLGSPDLDLRPAEMARSTLGMEITCCPNCHYVASDISAPVSETIRDFVLSDAEFQTGYRFRSVRAYRNLARIAVLEERYHDAFWAYLKAAWVEERRYTSKPSPNRQEALEFFLLHETELKFDNDTHLCMKTDLLRRTGHFKEVIELVQSAAPSERQTDIILHFQKHLAESEDTGCYTVGSANSWKEKTGFVSDIPEKEIPVQRLVIDFTL